MRIYPTIAKPDMLIGRRAGQKKRKSGAARSGARVARRHLMSTDRMIATQGTTIGGMGGLDAKGHGAVLMKAWVVRLSPFSLMTAKVIGQSGPRAGGAGAVNTGAEAAMSSLIITAMEA
mmetsp:Transcript_62563/g.127480  ORF Transcript_62563/g.127480 Transcript_62563/m.127480 type:complete len:119 (+) Transcript_62563:1024-1380(+)